PANNSWKKRVNPGGTARHGRARGGPAPERPAAPSVFARFGPRKRADSPACALRRGGSHFRLSRLNAWARLAVVRMFLLQRRGFRAVCGDKREHLYQSDAVICLIQESTRQERAQ